MSGAEVAIANGLCVRHVRGVSGRARPLFVEFHKHRGLWRYFGKFEAGRHGPATRLAVPSIWRHMLTIFTPLSYSYSVAKWSKMWP